jgi:divalent metal cation (Fe/Co/Zn/Cd) transporter
MTLMIIFASLVTIWIIYQSISLAIDDAMSLVGDYLPTSKTVHIFLLTLITYGWQLINHTHGSLPDW